MINSTPAVRYVASATKTPTAQNYLDLSDMTYLVHEKPDLDGIIHGRYGSQLIDGFFERTGRKIPYASDAITWTEEERITQLAEGVTRSSNVFTSNDHTFRVGEIITVRNADGAVVHQGRISATTTNTFTAACGTSASAWAGLDTADLVVFADFSEFGKGTTGMQESLNTKYQQYTNGGTIVKEMVKENRTNMTQISWLKIEDSVTGDMGYVWFFTNKENAEKRFRNARESANFNSKKWVASSDLLTAGYKGRQGFLDAIGEGNVYTGFINTVSDAESIVERLDKQGGIAENLMWGTTAFCMAQDRFLASTNTVGLSYGAFQNSKDMALELQFNGYSIGGYTFHYSRSTYLNHAVAQGSMVGPSKTNGFLIPSGSKSVRDDISGQQVNLPMIHVRNRQYGSMNRDYEMAQFDWAKGTSNTDEIRFEFQSEQSLCVIGRANTCKFVGS